MFFDIDDDVQHINFYDLSFKTYNKKNRDYLNSTLSYSLYAK